MKNALATLKKPVNILSIVAVVLVLLQVIVMLLPCVSLSPKPTRRDPNPPVTDYSLMNYLLTDTEAMEEGLAQKIDNYAVNDHVTIFVLVVVFSILALVFTILDIKNAFEVYKTLGHTVITIFSHTCCVLWAGTCLFAFLTSQVLAFSTTIVPTLGLIVSIAAVLAVVARLVIAVVPSKSKAAA